MVDRLSEICDFLDSVWSDKDYQLHAISGDASFRRYFRVQHQQQSYVLMDAPPGIEDGQRFLAVQAAFAQQQILVPQLVVADLPRGLLLLQDLGDELLQHKLTDDTVVLCYQQALLLLDRVRQVTSTAQGALPLFDAAFLQRELQLFIDWFLKVHLQLQLTETDMQILEATFNQLTEAALTQPQAGMHRDFHSRNLMVLPNQTLAVIDFQDAVIGPVSYDVVSLLKDCYIRWPDQITHQLRDWYFTHLVQQQALPLDYSHNQFCRDLDWLGLQRHLKVCGIFSRLFHRDQKAGYLADLPRVLQYVLDAAANYPELSDFHRWLLHRVVPAFSSKIK